MPEDRRGGTTWALLPVKSLDRAKSRLAGALDERERAALARCLLRGVIAALRTANGIDGVALVTADTAARELAVAAGCRWLADDATLGLSGNLDATLGILAAEGVRTAVIVPADLPLLTAADVDALLAAHGGDITVVPAAADGGTNALVMTPPGAIPTRYGPDSARLHLEAALQRGVPSRCLAPPGLAGFSGLSGFRGFRCLAPPGAPPGLAGFARDLDTVDDVRWLCEQPAGGETRRYLEDSGICARLCPRA